MNTIELLQLIENQGETQSIEFKQDTPWTLKSMAKDILAMANVRNGGTIIIGVRENMDSFEPTGVSAINLATYQRETMQDQISNHADPSVTFDVFVPEDLEGKKYVVIKVYSFLEVPVLSKVDFGDLKKGTIYYRSRNGRPSSAPVSNSTDLRDILDIAAVRLMQQRRETGYTVNVAVKDDPQNLQDNLPEPELLRKIKTKGYWEVQFVPLEIGHIEALVKLKQITENSQSTMEWPFPNIPKDNFHPCINGYEAESEHGARKEVWRIFQSEHFHYYGALIEDWLEGDFLRGPMAEYIEEMKYVFVFTSVIQFITHAFVFLENLSKNGFYQGGVRVKMTLHNTTNRSLYIDRENRGDFLRPRITKAPLVSVEAVLTNTQANNDALKISNRFIREFYSSFGFDQSEDTIAEQQRFFTQGY